MHMLRALSALISCRVRAGGGALGDCPVDLSVAADQLVVPYPPGALTDLLARAIGERLAAALGQPVVIDNRPGAGTLVGAESVAKAPADGYTLLMATSTTLGISPALYRKSPIDPVKDFAPVAQVGTRHVLPDREPGVPGEEREGDDRRDRANPGKFNYASVGNGSPHQLFMEVLKGEYGLDIQHVPYKGTLAALPDLLTGEVQADVHRCDRGHAEHPGAARCVALGTSGAKPTTLLPERAADRRRG